MRRHAMFGVIVVTALLLTACSGGGSSSPTNKRSVLTYAYAREFSTLDPSVAAAAENDVFAGVYETLATYDPKASQAVPRLATGWEHNSDATEWTFHLRSGVKFQDGS